MKKLGIILTVSALGLIVAASLFTVFLVRI